MKKENNKINLEKRKQLKKIISIIFIIGFSFFIKDKLDKTKETYNSINKNNKAKIVYNKEGYIKTINSNGKVYKF